MKTFAAILSATLIALALAKPHERRDVHCGTTDDATLSDCQALVTDKALWDSVFNTGNICHFTNVIYQLVDHEAYNVACHGDCCVYAAGDSAFEDPQGGYLPDRDRTFEEAAGLLGCGDPSTNKINVMQSFSDNHAVCLSNGNGCGDCFDDADYRL
ncbi:hypothetical protein V5O48_000805 [Marasmius crinis-equi]|uniref:Uncharacterized protein n=1 Tax=Marasmius crinis-equi TaxID=585013 RepID=A0ABR3G0A2_9AGAR